MDVNGFSILVTITN